MDLSSMFQNLGPAGGAMLTGMQMADATNEQKSQEAYRKAQMEDIMQRTSQQAELHPLELQSKKQGIEKSTQDLEKGKVELEKAKYDLTVGKLEGAVKKADSFSQLMGVAAAQLVNIPSPARHAWLANFAQQNGIDANDPAVKSIWQQTSQIPPEKLPQALNAFRDKIIQQSTAYRSHLDGIREQGKNQITIEGMREVAKQKLAEEKLNKLKSYEAQISAAKGDKNKASVARQWAMTATDEKDRAEYERQATIYDAAALEQNPATIKNKGEQEAFDRLSGKARPLGPTPKPTRELTIEEMKADLKR